MRIVDLRTEYTTNLLGTDVERPRLSWRIESDRAGTRQSSYRLRAAASAEALDGGALLWDSGEIAGDASFDIAYGSPSLAPMQRIWWSVEATDDVGTMARSAPAWFETGLTAPDSWHADWIEAEDDNAAADRAAGLAWIWSETALDDRPHAFRIDFDAPEDLVRAEVLLAGKDHLRGVWINGEASPLDWQFDWDTYLPFWGTLAPYQGEIRPGRNSVCALVEADTTGFFPVDGGAFAALIRLHRADGSVERLVSGPASKVQPNPPADWTSPQADTSDWPAAQPSGANVHNDPRPSEPAMLLRTEFDVRGPVVAARLYATALGAYDARINGQKVSDALLAPEVTVARDHILYRTYDVTDLIAPGANALAATVGD
ncbi:MAG TPA: alpha-L-rhamnosidase N-terminal domain-containing protein, partial [Sphingomonas sp.]|nr:alpha-L-rhamnosidase N-terminal domain-containing protein [Sphingomonas sp.]